MTWFSTLAPQETSAMPKSDSTSPQCMLVMPERIDPR